MIYRKCSDILSNLLTSTLIWVSAVKMVALFCISVGKAVDKGKHPERFTIEFSLNFKNPGKSETQSCHINEREYYKQYLTKLIIQEVI